jgi:8-oxo-dGTP pyrophosphatase MutT (NUDIX family)
VNTSPIVTIIIKNQLGQFFVHQRSSNKKTFPNKYGIGAGGHIEENETNEEAAHRELKEEANLDTPVRFLFDINYKDDHSDYPVYVYETINDGNIDTNISEWQWSGWLDRAELNKLMEDDKLCPDTAQFYKKYLDEFSR